MPCSLHCLFSLDIPGASFLLPSVLKPIWCKQRQSFSSNFLPLLPRIWENKHWVLFISSKQRLNSTLFCTVPEHRISLNHPLHSFVPNCSVHRKRSESRCRQFWACCCPWAFLCCNLSVPWLQWSQIPSYRSTEKLNSHSMMLWWGPFHLTGLYTQKETHSRRYTHKLPALPLMGTLAWAGSMLKPTHGVCIGHRMNK